MEQRLGTCMDLTLLYAACLESLGLHPLLVMMDGHIFAGVWLRERSAEELKSHSMVIESVRELRMRCDNGSDELTFVECTSFCAGKEVDFEDSERMAKQMLAEADMFRYAVDVACARNSGIRPLAFRIRNGGEYVIPGEDKAEEHITSAPARLDITASDRETGALGKPASGPDAPEHAAEPVPPRFCCPSPVQPCGRAGGRAGRRPGVPADAGSRMADFGHLYCPG